jgi:hypothetical protein
VSQLVARSISRSVHTRFVADPGPGWRVLAVFDRACELASARGEVVAIVLPEIGDGPLNVVVPGHAGVFAAAQPGILTRQHEAQLQIGGLCVTLDGAVIWEPCPDWERLRRNRGAVEHRLPLLQRFFADRSLSDLTGFAGPVRSGLAFQQALLDLRAGWAGDPARLSRGARHLAGLGSGLTPAGDDFLAGLMLRAWLAHPEPEVVCHIVVSAAAPRTTTLSAAVLRAAGRGECSAPWHRLLQALETGTVEELTAAAQGVLSYGETSGTDVLAGFLDSQLATDQRDPGFAVQAERESASDTTARIASARASGTSS